VTFGAIVLLAVGLAMDATAVAAIRGLAAARVTPRDAALVGTLFGCSQAVMPVIGWVIGQGAGPFVQAWDHWVAFVLLAGIGAKMLWESRAAGSEAHGGRDVFAVRTLLLLAVATSIDALAVGITLPLLHAPLILSVITIGIVTAALSVIGLFAGRHFGPRLGPRLDAFGGLVLVTLGVKILVDHLRAG
jgi:putative Mn2+ efflux pump MntP